MIHTISDGKYTAKIDDFGAELVSAVCDGFELIWRGEEYWLRHAPILFPVCGRLKDKKYTLGGKEYTLDIHGFISKRNFELVEKTATKIVLKSTSDEETRAAYPFDFTFIAEYELSDGKIFFRTKIKNESDELMPFLFGWHPGFSYPDGVNDLEELTLDFCGKDEVNNHPISVITSVSGYKERLAIPDGKLHIDSKHLYEIDTIALSDTGNRVILTDGKDFNLKLSWSENLPFLCIWKFRDDGARYLCLEPWSNAPRDGEKTQNFDVRDMTRLNPHATEEFVYELELVK